MLKRTSIIIIGLAIVGSLLLCTVAYTVDYTEWALVKTFGEPSAPINGRTDGGLKFKLPYPIQSLTKYPATMYTLEATTIETPTSDNQNIVVTTYCVWRISDPVKFLRAVSKVEMAQNKLRDWLNSDTDKVVNRHALTEFVNTDGRKMQLPEIEKEILDRLAEKAQSDYGVQVVSVGVKSLALPEAVTAAVISKMKQEREAEAQRLRNQGEATATAIRERADSAARMIGEFAKKKADSIESEGYLAAKELYPKFKENEQFSMFLRMLKSMEKELSGRSVVLLDGSLVPGIKFLGSGPALPEAPTPVPVPPAVKGGIEKNKP
ncbi:MAG: protease modulator HflC [Planctomycetaceae bacterium]|nr:protease modulator HflC [Planctomycetaceae bacterium]